LGALTAQSDFSAARKGEFIMSLQSLNQSRRTFQAHDEPLVQVVPICSNSLLRLGLENILSDTRFVVSHRAYDGASEVPGVQDEASVLFIVDGSSHLNDAVDQVRQLRTHSPTAKIVVLADRFQADTVAAAWEAGANGFCLSKIKRDILIRSLELVMLGEAVLPFSVVLSAMEELAHHANPKAAEATWNIENSEFKGRKLSGREAEILVYLKEGAPNKVIARKLNLSEATVKVHVKAILKKVGAGNRTQAALWAAHNLSTGADACGGEVT
jgi:two-component system nitrate/nitrite response regulator NarL